MTVTATLKADPCQFARFTWNADLTECDFLAFGEEAEAALDSLVAASVHEGAEMAGWVVSF